MKQATRDPRVNPKAGDVFRKWNQNFLVESFSQGAVYTKPALSDRGWVGILFFREWAADAEVATVANESSTFPDHRIFGFDLQNRYRANLYHGAGHPYAGSLYSWLVAPSECSLTNKLSEQWEQPLSEEEWDMLEAIEGETVEVSCDDCGGSGVDVGGLSPYEPEPCRACGGSGCETVSALVGFGTPAPAPRMASIGNGLYVRTRKAVA